MRRDLILLVSCFILTNALFSQADFRKGFLINNSNDTVFGWIDYKGSISNSRKCVFTKDINTAIERVVYTPNDIRAYRYTDSKYYISKVINISERPDTLFLEYLLNGIVDVYFYRDGSNDHYLIQSSDGKIVELKNDEKSLIINDKSYVGESKQYVGILKYYFRDSPKIAQEAEETSLDHESLIRIAKDYHNAVCTDSSCIIYEKKLPKVKVVFGLQIGLHFNNLAVRKNEFPDYFYYFRDCTIEPSVTPSAGLFLNISMPLMNERTFLQFETNYQKKNFKIYHLYEDDVKKFKLYDTISLNMSAFSIGMFLKYKFINSKIRPMFLGGGFVNYYVKNEFTRNLDVFDMTSNTHYPYQFTDSPFGNSELGFTFGVGCVFKIYKEKELNIDFKYQRAIGIMQNMVTKDYSITIGFPFI